MLWALILGGIVLGGAVLHWVGKRPIPYRVQIRAIIDVHVPNLLRHAPNAQFFIAERVAGPGFLQLAVTQSNGQWRVAEFGIPEAHWVRPLFDDLARRFGEEGFAPAIEDGSTEEVPRFLRVRLEGPFDTLVPQFQRILAIAVETLHWGEATEYVLKYT